MKMTSTPKDFLANVRGERPAAGAASVPDRNGIARPMLGIPPEEIGNILVFSDIGSKPAPKVGESAIEFWPLTTSLARRYPDATIYVATAFPDAFMARQFKGRIKAIPRNDEDAERRGYDKAEWKDYTCRSLSDMPQGKRVRARFIVEKGVDMVVDSSLVPGRFRGISAAIERDFPGKQAPHVFSAGSVMRMSSAGSRALVASPPAPLYEDRSGNARKVAGIETVLEDVAPGGIFKAAGLWEYQMALCRILGLEVDRLSLASIRLDAQEAADARETLLCSFRSMHNCVRNDAQASGTAKIDPLKKIVVVNVYAVTHRFDIVDRAGWMAIVGTLARHIENAYLALTRGGPMDEDASYADGILRDVERSGSEVLLPRTDDIYPLVHGILGISSGLVTVDTGMSHVGSAVYGIPTAVMTTPAILHWLAPGDNVYPVTLDRGTGSSGDLSKLLDKLRDYAALINNAYENTDPNRPAQRGSL